MPTVCALKDELKALGVRGYSGKKKGELEDMLRVAKGTPVIKSKEIENPVKVIQKRLISEINAPKKTLVSSEVIPRISDIEPKKVRDMVLDGVRKDFDSGTIRIGDEEFIVLFIDDMKKWFSKLDDRFIFSDDPAASDARTHLRKIREYVDKKTFIREEKKYMLSSDWEKIFK
jgi:hypothetical protein